MQKARTYLEFLACHCLDQCQRLYAFLFILQACPILTVKCFLRFRFYGNNNLVTNLNISKNFDANIQHYSNVVKYIFKPYIRSSEDEAVLRQI
jgi:hypothetical protein